MEQKIENPQNNIEKSKFEQEKLKKLYRLRDVIKYILKDPNGATYASFGEEGFSGDAASLYTLIEMLDEKGEIKPELFNIGWGEFSKNTFIDEKYPQFQNLPFDIYCLTQSDSYFSGFDKKLSEQMQNDPINYLKEKSILVSSENQVEVIPRFKREEFNMQHEVRPVTYDKLLRDSRNLAIDRGSTRDEFADFLNQLPDDPSKVWEFIQNNKNNKNVRVLYHLGIEHVGSAIGDIESMKSLVEIKKEFDFEKKSF
jgi:hypothetical protein